MAAGRPLSLLTPVTDLRKYWPWIRAGLEEIKSRYYVDWIPEDIYGVLKAGNAGCNIVGNEEGFIILQPQSRFTGPCLFVWVIWGDLAEYEPELYDELEQIARNMKAATIEAQGRMGWSKRGFFRETGRVYVREM